MLNYKLFEANTSTVVFGVCFLGVLFIVWALLIRGRRLVVRNVGRWARTQGGGDDQLKLKVLQINVWSGSTYELHVNENSLLERVTGIGNQFEYYASETLERRQQRFESLVAEIEVLRPDVITLNEVMPCPEFALNLARRIGFDVVARKALAGIVFGGYEFPKINEGDAILAHPSLNLHFQDRIRLSGFVFSDWLSFNFNDATQALGATISLQNGENILIVCTHWHAGLLDDPETNKDVEELSGGSPILRKSAQDAIQKSTEVRIREALKTSRFVRQEMARSDAKLAILCGDLNTTLDTPEMRVLLTDGFLHGSKLLNADDAPLLSTWDPVANPNVLMQIEAGVEGQSQRSEIENQLYARFAKRSTGLDHILFKTVGGGTNVKVGSYNVAIRGEGQTVVPSDHYGILVTVQVK